MRPRRLALISLIGVTMLTSSCAPPAIPPAADATPVSAQPTVTPAATPDVPSLSEIDLHRLTVRDVTPIDANGLVTAVAPGGIEVEFGGHKATATIIVYTSFIQVPPHDPDREREWNGGRLIVNRLIVSLATDTYDAALTAEIAADYGAEVIAEWRSLNGFLLEFPGVYEVSELIAIAERMDDDDRIAAYQADSLLSAD